LLKEGVNVSKPFKRFLVFGCEQCYPAGGLDDIIASVDTPEEVQVIINARQWQYYDVLDLETRTICEVK
jgi:hypothetical protein